MCKFFTVFEDWPSQFLKSIGKSDFVYKLQICILIVSKFHWFLQTTEYMWMHLVHKEV